MSDADRKISLGKFELSLTVRDIHESLEFYTKLGFEKVHGVRKRYFKTIFLEFQNC